MHVSLQVQRSAGPPERCKTLSTNNQTVKGQYVRIGSFRQPRYITMMTRTTEYLSACWLLEKPCTKKDLTKATDQAINRSQRWKDVYLGWQEGEDPLLPKDFAEEDRYHNPHFKEDDRGAGERGSLAEEQNPAQTGTEPRSPDFQPSILSTRTPQHKALKRCFPDHHWHRH